MTPRPCPMEQCGAPTRRERERGRIIESCARGHVLGCWRVGHEPTENVAPKHHGSFFAPAILPAIRAQKPLDPPEAFTGERPTCLDCGEKVPRTHPTGPIANRCEPCKAIRAEQKRERSRAVMLRLHREGRVWKGNVVPDTPGRRQA